MKKIIFKGCGTAIATPFDENGVNFKVFGDLIEHQISEGVDSIIVCGTTGEASTMTDKERKDTIKFAVDKVNKRIPVIAGTGSNNTKAAIEMTKYAESIGVDGALVVTPYYNKTTQKGLIEHYKAIASSTSLPIILYSVPSRTGVNILPETCLELSKIENVVAIKEASGNISQVAQIASLCGENLNIYSGNDDQIVPILSVGGIGVISVLSNLYPKYTHEMVYDYLNGNIKEATRKQLACLDLVDNLFSEVNPIPVKAGLNMIGYDFGIPRLPLIEMSMDKQKLLKEAIELFSN
ncbi:MAG: 4-hydroxy-tetrahydrodipicolinate synthase [Clostridia bacterium]|nr:4-hydroxy-tetrahydrodipicolinate synthase [Clostridia bacterium]